VTTFDGYPISFSKLSDGIVKISELYSRVKLEASPFGALGEHL